MISFGHRSGERGRLKVVVASAALLAAFLAVPTQAQAGGPSGVGTHCVATLAPVAPGATVSQVVEYHCYASFSQAISAATQGKVQLPSDATPADLAPDALTATSVLGIDFSDWHFSGASFTATANNSYGCSGGHNYAISSMPPTWNDVVSSNYPSSGCDRAVHWENTGFDGASIACRPSTNCYYIGDAMNDRTSSEQWFDV